MPGPVTAVAAISRARSGVRLIGIEREYCVLDDGRSVDARTIWSTLPDPGPAIDPGDPNSRRCSTGAAITTDGPHAEIATPPVDLRPGCTVEVLAQAAAAETHLRRQVGSHCLAGYSTHINVEVDDRIVVRVARVMARRLALPIMLGVDRADSPGLLIRPRPGRLEVGGEFVAGDQLRAATAITIAMVLLAESRLGPLGWRRPMDPRPTVARATERFGWYVDRRAFGPDLYRDGRAALIGGRTADDVLGRLWQQGRRCAAAFLDREELVLVDDLVAGRRPLPVEKPCLGDGPTAPVRTDRSYAPRRRGGITVTVTDATWWRAVVELRTAAGSRWLTVPGRSLDDLLAAIDDGRLDDDLLRIAAD